MKNIIKKILDGLVITKPPGFPSFTALIVNHKFKKIKYNQSAKGKQNSKHHFNHAEFLLIEALKKCKRSDNIIMIQLFPPCGDCLQELKALNYKIKIIYFFDPEIKIWRKNWREQDLITFERIYNHYYEIIDFAGTLYKNKMFTRSHYKSRQRLTKEGIAFENIKKVIY